ncbi:hypothetical protein [Flavobacterium sp. AG291]|uniref:hypothetical protein n=1 Tax=Flavobacterium sp. AG291 TaxID=2184000 RepID=UPI000E2D43E5|nr:hypothetical protein [Flavobacterium sp. AG291]RDI06693.1 integrase-like protein [Flavobacterium sp. AG291]
MAAVNFLYRSNKESAHLILRLLYRYDNKDYVFGTSTKYEVSKEYWSKQHKKRLKDIDMIERQANIKADLNKIENHILKAFNESDISLINKEWLETQINTYYSPSAGKDILPKELVKYMDTYIDFKRNEVTESTLRKCRVIKQVLIRFEAARKKPILILDIDTHFKRV